MKQNLGKIIFLILCIVSLNVNLSANSVNVSVAAPAIYKGDSVSFTISATGSDVEFPDITNINGYAILGTSSRSSTSIINGDYSKTISKSYSFAPTKDVTIPSFKIKVDGDTLTTKTKKISVIKPAQSKSGDPFIVELKVDKSELKVGESTTLKIIFKQRLDAKASKLNINEPKIENFWIKKIDKTNQYSQGQYVITEYSYLIFAQKAGNFKLNSIEADIGKLTRNASRGGFFNDPFFNSMTNQISWQKIYSNSLSLKVDKLPNDIELYGDFTIDTKVDKNSVFINKPVNLTISIKGKGNVDDIEKFDINLQNAIVYPDKPKINSNLQNGEYQGTFVQKIAIISDKDFVIPSLKLTYFDKLSNKIKTISTQAIDIKVKGQTNSVQTTPMVQKLQTNTKVDKLQSTKVIVKEDKNLQYIYLLIGLILGSFITYIIMRQQNRKIKPKEQNSIVKLIKDTKDDKKLFEILLPYSNDNIEISDILKQLEENIYKKTNHKIDKQRLYDIFL